MPRNRRSTERVWQHRGLAAWTLLPVGLFFFLVVALRRALYRLGVLKSIRLPVPVLVVGNITAGGSGKTPLAIRLVEALRRCGRRPGVVSRGYGGNADGIVEVLPGSDPSVVGDEPLLIRRRAGCPVYVGRDRASAALQMVEVHGCDIVVCDDGLQHYRLARDVEIAVVDRRGAMNGWPLPAGPLREPLSRLATVDAVVANGWTGPASFRMRLAGERFERLAGDGGACTATDLSGKRLHAVAGIGEPQRFFDHLSSLGLRFEAHPFPDHHAFGVGDLDFDGDAILTTEKDAVKFPAGLGLPVWVLPVVALVEPDLAQFVLEKIDGSSSA